MTNHWVDMQNSDVIFVIGGNPAENHPISFVHIEKAMRERGAKLVCVDPRFTRTASKADLYAPLRSGTDIPFIFGLMKYAIDNNLYFEDYVKDYTNAAFIVNDDYKFEDGLFSGFTPGDKNDGTGSYSAATWAYKKDEEGAIIKDRTLKNPRSVWQLLIKHLERYDVDTVCAVTGCPKDKFLEVAKIVCSTGTPDRTGSINYAMGCTQHTVGSQNVRSYAMLQLILGNIGVPGGGVNALRGEANVQGSTDHAMLFNNFPGYLPAPTVTGHPTLEAYNATTPGGYWSNRPRFLAATLKAWYGDYATKANDFAYDLWPKATGNHSYISIFEEMYNDKIKGLICWGQNPIVGGPNTNKERKALAKLDWLVSIDLYETETSTFWQDDTAGALDKSAEIMTEVFFLPANASLEKEGTISNSGRWSQYRWKAVKPRPGINSRSDLFICSDLGLRIKKLYEGSTAKKDLPITKLVWNYADAIGEYPKIQRVVKEISGYNVKTGKTIPSFATVATDLDGVGDYVMGNWIYGGMHVADVDVHTDQSDEEFYKNYKCCNRDDSDTSPTGKPGIGNNLGWAYSWPVNRRILYNRASADPQGRPWDEGKADMWFENGAWTGHDVADFAAPANTTEDGKAKLANPYLMMNDGVAALYAPTGMADGPFPEHYEPYESPFDNIFSSVDLNPAVHIYDASEGSMNKKSDRNKFPIIATTYRMCEHWQSGTMTRNLAWLAELVPHMFVEMSEELAKEKGIANGDKIVVSNARGDVNAVAMVTKRFKPFNVHGKTVHHLGMPWHFGFKGIATGDQANFLTAFIGCANTRIPESKAFLCDVRRA